MIRTAYRTIRGNRFLHVFCTRRTAFVMTGSLSPAAEASTGTAPIVPEARRKRKHAGRIRRTGIPREERPVPAARRGYRCALATVLPIPSPAAPLRRSFRCQLTGARISGWYGREALRVRGDADGAARFARFLPARPGRLSAVPQAEPVYPGSACGTAWEDYGREVSASPRRHRLTAPRLSLKRARRQAGDDLPFGEEVEDERRQRGEGDEGVDQRDIEPVLTLELHGAQRQGP